MSGPRYTACLLDVYETVLTVDGQSHLGSLAALAGVEPRALGEALAPWRARVNDGRAGVRDALAGALAGLGRAGDDALLDRLVTEDRRLLAERVVVPSDVLPALDLLRARDVRTAFVSNCADNTRPMLEQLGLSGRVDELVLSCEVGAAKPDALIYETALAMLGVGPRDAVLVDDQPAFCEGAASLGIRAVRIDRRHGTGDAAALADVLALF